MHRPVPRSYWISTIVLGVAGIAITIVLQVRRGSSPLLFLTDLLFVWGSLFLFWGCICGLNNVHAFTSFSWGVKSFRKLLQNRQLKGEEQREAYFRYRNSRPHHDEAGLLLLTAIVLLLLSVLMALVFF